MQIMIAFVLLFPLLTISLAAEVTIYDGFDYFHAAPGSAIPRAVSHTPWRFAFNCTEYNEIIVKAVTKSPGIKWNITSSADDRTVTVMKDSHEFYFVSGYFDWSHITIKLNLYRDEVLCSSLVIAEGRRGYERPLFSEICKDSCVLEVDTNYACLGPPLVNKSATTTVQENDTAPDDIIETTTIKLTKNVTSPSLVNKSEITTTVKADVENVTSPDDIIETTTIVTKNSASSTTTDNSTVIIIVSSFGVVVVLIVIVVGCKCWVKQNASGIPRLPTTAQSEPFYLNLLFRRECDQEIAEIEQHHYETIEEQQNGETENIYDEPK